MGEVSTIGLDIAKSAFQVHGVDVNGGVTPTSLPQIKAGKLRPVGVTTTGRLPLLSDVPTVGRFLKGYEAAGWIGFGVPKGTPPTRWCSTELAFCDSTRC